MSARSNETVSHNVPEIVHIVLSQAEKHHRAGLISDKVFNGQLRRITEEELTPRRLILLVRGLPDGSTSFVIKPADSVAPEQPCEEFAMQNTAAQTR